MTNTWKKYFQKVFESVKVSKIYPNLLYLLTQVSLICLLNQITHIQTILPDLLFVSNVLTNVGLTFSLWKPHGNMWKEEEMREIYNRIWQDKD